LYTFYFQFILAKTSDGLFFHLLFLGGTLVALGIGLERYLSRDRALA
jgi:hypothetical protein